MKLRGGSMKPYYEDGSVTIWHGDCRDVLPTLASVDVFVTDPPYGVDGGRGGDARDFQKASYGSSWPDTPRYVASVCVPTVTALAEVCRAGAVTPGIRCLMDYPGPRDIGCFWTPASVTHGPWGFTTFQPILYYGKDWRAGLGALPSGRVLTAPAKKNGHPCPKPLDAWQWLVDKVAKEDEAVLDPFMGSGTTLVAAKNLGREAIGIEIEEKYCEIAALRCSQEVLALAPPTPREEVDHG